jgi:hypothetical protein
MFCKIGDYIIYRPNFGMDDPVIAKVARLQITELPRQKYGQEVTQVDWYDVQRGVVVFSLDNLRPGKLKTEFVITRPNDEYMYRGGQPSRSWCYSDQVQTSWSPDELREILESPTDQLPTHLGRSQALDGWIANRLREEACPTQASQS